jgi:hypothetical protein
MEEHDFLEMGVGSQMRSMKITEIKKEEVQLENRDTPSEKVVFTVVDDNELYFQISDVWLDNLKKGGQKIQGIWFSTSIDEETKEAVVSPNSSLARLLAYYDKEALKHMMDTKVFVYPDQSNYLVLVGCDMSNI